MDLGSTIRSLRQSKDMTQKDLADKTAVSASTIGMYEQGRRVPDIDTIKKIASSFNVSVDFLLGTEKTGGNNYSNYQLTEDEFNLKETIRNLMNEKKMSEEEFKRKAGFSNAEYDSYLYESKRPSLEALIKISGVLNVSTDYLLGISTRKRITEDEELLLQSFNKCDGACKKYILAKAGVLCVEGISAVAAAEYGRYVDEEKKSFPSSGTGGTGA